MLAIWHLQCSREGAGLEGCPHLRRVGSRDFGYCRTQQVWTLDVTMRVAVSMRSGLHLQELLPRAARSPGLVKHCALALLGNPFLEVGHNQIAACHDRIDL